MSQLALQGKGLSHCGAENLLAAARRALLAMLHEVYNA